MNSDRDQQLLPEIAKRDAIIAHQAGEIALLKQSIDALTRRIFGATSEKGYVPQNKECIDEVGP